MSRLIKFRAWDKVNNKFFENIYEAYNGNLQELVINLDGAIGIRDTKGLDCLRADDFILEQWTGLHDKHGKEIYEGDILELVTSDYKGGLFKIIYSADGYNSGFALLCIKPSKYEEKDKALCEHMIAYPNHMICSSCYKIIGNIHQHSHLLDKEDTCT